MVDKTVCDEVKRLMNCFPNAFINKDFELILIKKTNTYFNLSDCESKRDVIAKVIMWCIYDIRFKNEYRNYLNEYLETNFSRKDLDLIYTKLGNGIKKELTYRFIDSNFDMSVLVNS